jgi:hypothetical protein
MVQDGQCVFLEYKFKNEIRSKYTGSVKQLLSVTSTIKGRSNVIKKAKKSYLLANWAVCVFVCLFVFVFGSFQ